MSSSDLTDPTTTGKALWAAGNYDAIAELTADVGAAVAGAVAIEAGMTVLDVGTGTGSAAIPAALRGGEVTGLDISSDMLDGARRRAAEAGVEVEWVEGDAEALPYPDDSFDRVLTAFGTTLADNPDVAANEMVRVCRPGGEIVMANWCPDGFPGRVLNTLREYLPSPAGETVALTEWGTHGHLRRRLGGQLVLAIEPGSVDLVFESPDAMLAHYEENLAPLVGAKAQLEPQRYDELRDALRALIEELDAGEGETRVAATYLLVIGHKPVADLRPNC